MGYRILSDDTEEDFADKEGPRFAEENFVWTYTTREFPMVQVSSLHEWAITAANLFEDHLCCD